MATMPVKRDPRYKQLLVSPLIQSRSINLTIITIGAGAKEGREDGHYIKP